jgi:hypothetical protein
MMYVSNVLGWVADDPRVIYAGSPATGAFTYLLPVWTDYFLVVPRVV